MEEPSDYKYQKLYEQKARQVAALAADGNAASIDRIARLLALEDASREFHSRIANKIGEDPRDLAMVEVRSMLYRINRKCNEIKKDVRRNMTTGNESPLDQALDNLETAGTNKLAEDQIVDGLAAQAQDETAETARVQAVADKLNQETAAEQALVASQTAPATPAAPAAPAAPASGDTTTTTGS